ncbi:hypothetical protein HBZC1_11050 [Helicobacter bizzozeronii CIII-1]|uniref:Uncharacterized protein n=1 Tax=Helicobacter bizzozeronii (strain CIII-1) TaxID=1002804 RepID=F8KTE0_HELBC|nr:hypothetical protein HBZC1_11050 [Helicobacter bizzozeronii CIII-1]
MLARLIIKTLRVLQKLKLLPIKRSTTLGGAFALYIIKPSGFRYAPLNAPLERLTLASPLKNC